MMTLDFNSSVKAAKLTFKCIECGETVETDFRTFPAPNFMAEKYSDSVNDDWDSYCCPKCEKEYEVGLYASFWHKSIEIYEPPEEYEIEIKTEDEPYDWDYLADEQWRKESSEFLKIFEKNISGIDFYLNVETPDADSKNNLNVMAFAHVVSALEGFLSSTFIHAVFNSEDRFKSLLEHFPALKEQKISLIDALTEDYVKKVAEKALNKFIFHNVRALKPLYKEILGFDLTPDLQWLGKSVSKRHDCAHRAGYTKDGQRNVPSKDEIITLINNSQGLVERIISYTSKVN